MAVERSDRTSVFDDGRIARLLITVVIIGATENCWSSQTSGIKAEATDRNRRRRGGLEGGGREG